MLPLNRNEIMPGGNVIRQEIEFDRIGRRVAYHFLRRHPGDVTDPGLAGDIVRIPASEIAHVIDPVDAGQLRGVSSFAASIVKLFLLDQYDDAELDRKKVAAMHALFITTPAPAEPLDAVEGRDENEERTIDLQPGQITMLEPGEEVQTSDPANSGQTYEPFQYRTLLQVSAALGLPYGYVSNDMLKANYSNSRLALLEFRRRIEAYQHAVMVWCAGRCGRAGWMSRCSPARSISPTTISAGANISPAPGCRRNGTGGPAQRRPRRDRADRGRPQEPHAGAGRARLRRRAGDMRIARSLENEVSTAARGFRKATSVYGTLTGLGGDIFIIDDPQKPVDAQSDTQRNALNQWVSNTLMSRLDSKERGVVIVVMQRVHLNDLSGYLIESGDWTVLSLPAIAEQDEVITIGNNEFHQRRAGEALHPNLKVACLPGETTTPDRLRRFRRAVSAVPSAAGRRHDSTSMAPLL